jgi:DNA-binding response OmpR family regulator
MTKMLKLTLEQDGEYEVKVVNKATQAVSDIREFKPDLVLLDIMMPELQGTEIAALMIGDPELCEIKIIFLTALVTKLEAPSSGKLIGGRRFLAKPVKAEELLASIEEELRSHA